MLICVWIFPNVNLLLFLQYYFWNAFQEYFRNFRKSIAMQLLLITILLLGLAFAGIAIKIWGKKDGKFAGTCASQSPFLNKEGEACSFCGKMPDEMSDCSGEKKAN